MQSLRINLTFNRTYLKVCQFMGWIDKLKALINLKKFLFVGTKAHVPKNEAKKMIFNFKDAWNYKNAVYFYETVNQAKAAAYPNASSDPRQLLLCAVLVGDSVYVELNAQMNQALE